MFKKFGVALSGSILISAFGIGGANAANPPLPNLTNLNFENYTGTAPKGCFQCVNPVGWTGGSGLIYIDGQDAANSAAGPIYLTTYGNPMGTVAGNYVEADGNPTYESGFNYEVTGLTVGQTYSLSFYQGASSQAGFGYNPVTNTNSGTTNQWIVSLGTAGMAIDYNAGPYDPVFGQTSTYFNTDPTASIATSSVMDVPYQGTVGWDYVTVNLTADSTTDLLSFLAWGDNGSTVNLPPIAFLAGVNSPPGLGSGAPEPAAWAMLLIGFLGLGGMIRHRNADRSKAAQVA